MGTDHSHVSHVYVELREDDLRQGMFHVRPAPAGAFLALVVDFAEVVAVTENVVEGGD